MYLLLTVWALFFVAMLSRGPNIPPIRTSDGIFRRFSYNPITFFYLYQIEKEIKVFFGLFTYG